MGSIASGTPISEFGGTDVPAPYFGFIGARGSHGRTPTIGDLSPRFGYQPRLPLPGESWTRLTA